MYGRCPLSLTVKDERVPSGPSYRSTSPIWFWQTTYRRPPTKARSVLTKWYPALSSMNDPSGPKWASRCLAGSRIQIDRSGAMAKAVGSNVGWSWAGMYRRSERAGPKGMKTGLPHRLAASEEFAARTIVGRGAEGLARGGPGKPSGSRDGPQGAA